MKINALFVETDGVYFNHPKIEPWDITKDAKTCTNGAPAIAHPPCQRWGRYWSGGPSAKVRRKLGDDDGCFAFALDYVMENMGVIEHPEASHAWKKFGINKPPRNGGWIYAFDKYGFWTCCVEQGHYGHKARKATWLFFAGHHKPKDLIWGKSHNGNNIRVDTGFRSKEAAKAARAQADYKPIKRLSEKERLGTPIAFRDLLIELVHPLITELNKEQK